MAPSSTAGPSSSSSSSSTSPSSAALLSHLEQALNLAHDAYGPASPRGRVRLHVLFSTPRPCRDLYPYAHVFPQDPSRTAAAQPIDAYVEHVFVTAAWCSEGAEDKASGKLMYALECFLYTLPSHRSAILYVSKIDSSGWAPDVPASKLRPFLASSGAQANQPTAKGSFSATRTLTRAFLAYFAGLLHWKAPSPASSLAVEHISIHILARAQHAYLFPSSPENPRKRILSDGGLIQWWRAVISEALAEAKAARRGGGEKDASLLDTRPFYVIPGYSRLDSHIILPLPGTAGASGSETLAQAGWRYGHPYSQKGASLGADEDLPPLPLFGPSFVTSPKVAAASHPGINYGSQAASELEKGTPSIAVLMPHFSDDPKSRFIDELARDAHEQVGPMRRVPNNNASSDQSQSESVDGSARAPADDGAGGSAPEAKRQKTGEQAKDAQQVAADAVAADAAKPTPTGVALATSSAGGGGRRAPKFTAAHRAAVLERQALDETSADEFWERMGFRQECCSGNAVGVFVVLISEAGALERGAEAARGEPREVQQKVGPPPAQRLAMPHPTVQDLAFKNLMLDACEWNKEDEAVRLTAAWEEAIAKALRRKGGLQSSATGGEDADARPALDGLSKGAVWTDVVLDKGASEEGLRKAQKAWDEAEKDKAASGASTAAQAPAAPVNTLSVKRKKRA